MKRGEKPPSWDPGEHRSPSKLRALMRLIRVEHTLFSLPFAYAGALLSGYPCDLIDYVWMTLAVFGLRTAGMAYNNIADLDIDKLNPRCSKRPLVTGALKPRDAWMLVVAGSLLYLLSAAMLNKYALLLSPIPWAMAMSYPHAKRIHWMPHLHLGLVLSLTVLGGAVAASGDEARSLVEALKSVPWIYLAAVTLWVAGFDILYSIMDIDFDRKMRLGSAPSKLGIPGALLLALAMHIITSALLIASVKIYELGVAYIVATASASALMLLQHVLVRQSLSNIPRAFNLNLIIGLIITLGIIVDEALQTQALVVYGG